MDWSAVSYCYAKPQWGATSQCLQVTNLLKSCVHSILGAVIDLLFNGSVFYDNVASTGGAINWMNGRSLTLEMGEFHTNKAAVGGAIKAIVPQSAIDKLAISISNIAFRNNTALHGGAISVEGAFVSRNTDGDPNVKLERVRFSRNKAYNSCGAVAVRQTMMTVNQCNFTRNTAGYFGEERGSPGGSICASDLSRAYVNGSSFSRNSANVGGAMYVKDSILEVHKSEFNHNNATEGGGIAQTFHSASVPTNGALSSYTSSFLKHNSAFVGGMCSKMIWLVLGSFSFILKNQQYVSEYVHHPLIK